MDSLATKYTRKDVRAALKHLPKELNDMYDKAMGRIIQQNQEGFELAKQVLSLISYAFRPLTITEIQHALAILPDSISLDEEALPESDLLVSLCAGLVTIDQESNIIRFVHYTAHEYFNRTCMRYFPDAQTTIAKACLTYMSFDVFAKGYCPSDQEMDIRLQEYPFLQYAAQHWGDHARGDSEE